MSSDNKVDRSGLTYFWSKANAYVQETIEYAQQMWIKVGNSPMGTTAATITGAIKEVVDKIGNTAMGTIATTVTGAVKEHSDLIGDDTMGTTATTITGAIAEHSQEISDLDSKFNTANIVSITRIAKTMTTGSSGNIATDYANDGLTYIIAPIVSGTAVYLRTWISSVNNGWYFTAVNPNTGATINNTQLAIRYLVVKIKSA